MTIQDKTEAYYMAKFEGYIRQCKHFAGDADRLVPGKHGYWGDGYESF